MLVPRKLTARGSRGSTRTLLVWLSLATLLALIVAMLVLRENRAHPPLEYNAFKSAERASLPRAVLENGAPESARAAVDAAVPALPVGAASLALAIDPTAFRVVGRFVRVDGTPVGGVPLRLRATVDSESVDVTATSEESGRFTIAVAPRASLRVELFAEPVEHGAVQWEWQGVDHPRTQDVGDVTLYASGTIAGRILDQQGAPLVGQPWRIQLCQAAFGGDKGRDALALETFVDVATGTFEMHGLPPFRTQIVVDLERMNRFEGPIVSVRSNETTQVDLSCPFAGIRSSIVVRVAFPPFRDFAPPECAPVVLLRTGTANREARVPGSQFVFDDVLPGGSTLTIDDHRFFPWRKDDVEAGSVVHARLVGNASVRLTVVDGFSGLSIGKFVVQSEVDDDPLYGQQMHAQVYEAHAAQESHLLSGLLPIFQTLRVRAPGYADETIDVVLQPNAILPIEIALSRGGTVSGHVILADGTTPGVAVDVHLLRKPRPIRRAPLLLAGENGAQTMRTDASTGAFSFCQLPLGTYLIQASQADAMHGPLREVAIEERDAHQRADLVVPALAALSGRIVGPPGASFDGLKLHVVPRDQPFTEDLSYRIRWLDRLPVSIAADGSYRIADLPAGPVDVRLRGLKIFTPGFLGFGSIYPPAIELGTLDLVPGENRHDFTLGASFPGTVRVTARVDGQPAIGNIVELWTIEDQRYTQTAAAQGFERDASVRLGPLPPGEYPLVVRSVDTIWYWVAPNPVRIRSGEEVSVHCEVELVADKLRVRFQDTQEALVQGSVIIRSASLPGPRLYFPLDANGDAHLLLPPGEYTLGYSDDGRIWRKGIAVPFAWPLSTSRSREFEIPLGEKVVPQSARSAR